MALLMTVPVPVPPEPATAPPRVIRQVIRGWLLGWATVAVTCLWPLALLEAAWGVNGRPADQAWIVPIGLLSAGAIWGIYAQWGPKRAGSQLIVTPDRLEYRDPGTPPVVLERIGIALVDVLGSALGGQYLVTVHDHDSAVIALWSPRWAGWKENRVVAVLRAAGYPAARHRDIYDGRFQSQTVGQPPRMVR